MKNKILYSVTVFILASASSHACSNFPVVIALKENVEISTSFYSPILLCSQSKLAKSPQLQLLQGAEKDLKDYMLITENAPTQDKMKERYKDFHGPLQDSEQAIIKAPCTWVEFTPNKLTYKALLPKLPLKMEFESAGQNYKVNVIVSPETVRTNGKCTLRPTVKKI